jgi:hypothetical protein
MMSVCPLYGDVDYRFDVRGLLSDLSLFEAGKNKYSLTEAEIQEQSLLDKERFHDLTDEQGRLDH